MRIYGQENERTMICARYYEKRGAHTYPDTCHVRLLIRLSISTYKGTIYIYIESTASKDHGEQSDSCRGEPEVNLLGNRVSVSKGGFPYAKSGCVWESIESRLKVPRL